YITDPQTGQQVPADQSEVIKKTFGDAWEAYGKLPREKAGSFHDFLTTDPSQEKAKDFAGRINQVLDGLSKTGVTDLEMDAGIKAGPKPVTPEGMDVGKLYEAVTGKTMPAAKNQPAATAQR